MDERKNRPDPTHGYQNQTFEQQFAAKFETQRIDTEKSPENADKPKNNPQREPTPPEALMRAWEHVAERANAIMAIFTILIFAATTAYAVIATLQWCAMRESNEINRQLMLTNQKEIVGTYGASMVVDGPWIPTIGDDFDYFKTEGLGITFKNSGKVRAKDFSAEFTIVRKSLPDFKPIDSPQIRNGSKQEIRPPEQTSGQQWNDAVSLRFDVSDFTAKDLASIHAMKETIEIKGKVRYDDGFGDQSGDDLCFDYIAGVPMHVFKEGGVIGTPNDKGQWTTCDSAKQIVEQAIRWQSEKH